MVVLEFPFLMVKNSQNVKIQIFYVNMFFFMIDYLVSFSIVVDSLLLPLFMGVLRLVIVLFCSALRPF